MVNFILVLSDNSWSSNSEGRTGQVGDNKILAREGSNGSGSLVEDEPLSVVLWLVVSDSESELSSLHGFLVVKGSEGSHS